MTFICVSILAGEVHEALEQAEHARLAGADLVEYRLDHLFEGEDDHEGAEACERLVRESPLACVATCRPAWAGGDYEGSEAARLSLLERLATADHPPRYIDVELEVVERAGGAERAIGAHTGPTPHASSPSEPPGAIVSTHDFKGRPADLLQRLAKMREDRSARVHKIAYMARTIRDNLELFDLLAERERPMIALAMGEAGLMSRVLAPKFGGFLTFASLRPTTVTAPGQPTIADLLRTYRFRSIVPSTKVYGVVGWPISHSLSPQTHNAGFEGSGDDAGGARDAHDGVYLPLPVPPEWESFKATLVELTEHPRLDFAGASVTIPHKEHLVRLARERKGAGWRLDSLSDACGAGNTLTRIEDGWLVENTDARAATALVREALGEDLEGVRVTLLGAGGVARGIGAGLVQAGARVRVANRGGERAEAMAADLTRVLTAAPGEIEAIGWEQRGASDAEVVVNCTSVGMTSGPAADESPLDEDALAALSEDAVLFETVYAPLKTPLLREAEARGLRTIDGARLFVEQAALQFRGWTGREAPVGLFDRIVRDALRD